MPFGDAPSRWQIASSALRVPAIEQRRAASTPFWTAGKDALCARLGCGEKGLASDEAVERLRIYGPKADALARRVGIVMVVMRRLLEPLCLILLAAAVVAAATGDEIGGAIIVAILVLSIGLDTLQEHRAVKAACSPRSIRLRCSSREVAYAKSHQLWSLARWVICNPVHSAVGDSTGAREIGGDSVPRASMG